AALPRFACGTGAVVRYDLCCGGFFASAGASWGGGEAHPLGRAYGGPVVFLHGRDTRPGDIRHRPSCLGGMGSPDHGVIAGDREFVQPGGRRTVAYRLILASLLVCFSVSVAAAAGHAPILLPLKPQPADPSEPAGGPPPPANAKGEKKQEVLIRADKMTY